MNENEGWIPLDLFCERYNQRANTCQKRVHDGHWPRGEIYSSPTAGRPFVHEARAVAWLKEKGKL